ncbi:arginine deiminase [Nocardioides sp. ChNu-153]|uniref:arginine deiminase n=1 Tax=unclassified Nocardioides TaxID=2615069 RepID=UPI002405D899|nr:MULTISPECIES: arginine deiminase [unclassified Nocardioides]MDF9714893.1 arginine deiminase [Nocardioides sp. ChNu-99]MDN7123106.1 arginine deiminase [Nocardioides sp. ChNu-153]
MSTTPSAAPSAVPAWGADSEVGRLRTVMLHRPGNELKRLTPRNNDKLLFDGIPWVGRAQEEHDAFAEALRARDVEVLYLTELLTETFASPEARAQAITSVLTSLHLGDTLRSYLADALADASPEELTTTLTAGIRNDEVRGGHGLVTSLLAPDDFLVDPLPNLLFTRDSSVWVRDRVAVTSLAMPARARETQLTELIYGLHPRFAGTQRIHGWHNEYVEGGDVLLLAPGVIAVGVGERSTPAGVERLARQAFFAGLAHTVLAVPIAQERATMHLDTVCTMVDVDKVVMYPNVADSLRAHAVTLAGGPGAAEGAADEAALELAVAPPEPFLVAAARAMGIDVLHQIDTGLDPVTAEREQWDDGNNTLALAPRVAVAYERNDETNARLEAAGIEVVRIAGSELGSGRGGPRCMSCPVLREPLA